MTFEIRSSALDPFLTMSAQFSMTMAMPDPLLLIDGDNQIVTNALDRTDDPAVLITGNDNTFINLSGATLTGTGKNAGFFGSKEAAVEITGTGNTVENQDGGTITGAVGVLSSAANTSIVNEGQILAVDGGTPTFDKSIGIHLATDSSVINNGLVRADASGQANAIVGGSRTSIQNDGSVAVSGEFAFGIQLGTESSIVNSGAVDVSTTLNGSALSVGAGGAIQNFGIVRGNLDAASGNVFGVSGRDSMIWNGGTIEVIASAGGSAFAGTVGAGRIENEGTISATATGPTASSQSVGLFLSSGASGSNSGTITSVSGGGVSVSVAALSGGAFDNNGLISATGQRAVGFNGVDAVTLANSGTISASGAVASAILVDGDSSVENSGLITAEADIGGQPAVGIELGEAANARHTINNSGTIAADIAIAYSSATVGQSSTVLTVENSGQIIGAVELADGTDIVNNSGMIDGDVRLGAGNDQFDGRGGNVTGIVSGGDGNDVLRGGAGNDTLVGGAGNDVVAGGAGADIMNGDTDDPIDFGFDTLDYSDSPEAVQVNLGDASQSTSAPVQGAAGTGFGGHAEGDTFRNFEKVIGSAFDDFVYGAARGSIVELGDGNDTFDNDATQLSEDLVVLGAGNDVARTGAGDDFVEGGTGNDLLRGEDGGDFLLGGEGNDLLFGGAGSDQLDGGADADALSGGADGDALFGRTGNDLLSGGDGDDLLDGGTGNDLLLGGAGDDLFRFGTDGGQDLIVGFDAGAGTGDVVDLTAFNGILSFNDVLAIATETGSGAGVATVLAFDASTSLTFQGVQLAELNEADFLLV